MTRVLAIFDEVRRGGLEDLLRNDDPSRVRGALHRRRKTSRELALLLSPGADGILEEMAREAHRITEERFGRTMQLYAPLYLSNRCAGGCPYCGFSKSRRISRRALTVDEVVKEATILRESGMRSILLVSGDDPKHVDLDFLEASISRVQSLVPSVSLEVAPLSADGYRRLAAAGADGVTLYQETYDRPTYEALHPKGPKADFTHRLTALSRAGEAGFCKLNVGSLWGLAPWRKEALLLGLHASALQTEHWKSHISVGLPRLRQVPDDFEIPTPLDDRAFVHIIVALRVYLQDAGLVLSTRERPEFRDRLMPLGITQMSAGSCTKPGGYALKEGSGEQFAVADHRSPAEVAVELQRAGYEPVWKNWDRVFVTGGPR